MIKTKEKQQAEEYFSNVLVNMPSTQWMALVTNSIGELIENGVYEKFLLQAYGGCTLNYHNWELQDLRELFEIADRNKLLEEGDPLPGPGPFTIYRGVAGKGSNRKERGISWTGDFEMAVWYARRFEILLNEPTVYETLVQREHVLTFDNSSEESEFLCLLPDDQELKKVWPDKSNKDPKTGHLVEVPDLPEG
jgi:hypothetical protein